MGHGDAQGVYRTCNAEIRREHYPYGPPFKNYRESKLFKLRENYAAMHDNDSKPPLLLTRKTNDIRARGNEKALIYPGVA